MSRHDCPRDCAHCERIAEDRADAEREPLNEGLVRAREDRYERAMWGQR